MEGGMAIRRMRLWCGLHMMVIALLANCVIAIADPNSVSSLSPGVGSLIDWLDALDLPRPNGLPFVRVVTKNEHRAELCVLTKNGLRAELHRLPRDFPLPIDSVSWNSFVYYYGLLVGEDDESFSVFCADFKQRRFKKCSLKQAENHSPCAFYIKADLAENAEERLRLHRDILFPVGTRISTYDHLQPGVELAWLCWVCDHQKQTGIAMDLAKFISPFSLSGYTGSERTVKEHAETALNWYFMARWFDDLDDATVPYEALVAPLEWTLKNLPIGVRTSDAKYYAALLRRMDNQAREHAAQKSRGEVTPMQDMVFDLRNADDFERNLCEYLLIIDPTGQGKQSPSVTALLKAGHKAVPSLIDALDDTSLTRCVSYSTFVGHVNATFRVRDCAWELIREILKDEPTKDKWPKYAYGGDSFPAVVDDGGINPDEIKQFKDEFREWWARTEKAEKK
jgi:hypothetical protein